MLARFYLTRAGVETNGGNRNQQFLDSAKYYAARVINNSSGKPRPITEIFSATRMITMPNRCLNCGGCSPDPMSGAPTTGMPEYLAYSPDISFWWLGFGDKGANLVADQPVQKVLLPKRMEA